MNLTRLFNEFFTSEKTGGFLLIFCTIISLVLANLGFHSYVELWNVVVMGHSLLHWINDGLMTIFFLLIGLELEREIYVGELSNIKRGLFPVIAAVGGMLFPAMIYMLMNYNVATKVGAGIPISTDIAFAVGILSLLGSRVPPSLKVLLLAIAIIDDIGAILVIAFFYSGSINLIYLGLALAVFLIMLGLNRMKVNYLLPYLILGIVMWYFMSHTGIHPSLTGIFLAMAIPFKRGTTKSPSHTLQHLLHKPVSYIILPLFALANTCMVLNPGWYTNINSSVSVGILAGLIIGKPMGIMMFASIAVLAGICNLPEGLKWKQIAGVGILGGIGFTMSVFISILVFKQSIFVDISKMAILMASLFSAIIGLVWLRVSLPKNSIQL